MHALRYDALPLQTVYLQMFRVDDVCQSRASTQQLNEGRHLRWRRIHLLFVTKDTELGFV